ncbi:predicted protein [Scheffersomyces stipitis CBS 6054]|uniref:Nuclear rim protein 1 n=1 Tax=Scheffersomyces stipitis (strain ATCC 58785 / CBS 6054 / NBRC 10063 / NRRL Y-11545) TaxID=322104 RepID=A3LS51_PICST|nr:predicted protein [Scheffersomyces stipitis CBS 6054]ABN65846.2 predicted protein [Scheffersomyces stipitis CBS 6054]
MAKKLIRRQSIFSKIKSYPFDFYLYINEVALSIEWDEYIWTIAMPLGVLLTMTSFVIQAVLNYYNSINSKSNNALFSSDYYKYERLKSSMLSGNRRSLIASEEKHITTSFVWFLNTVSTAIIVISLVNTFQIFSARRSYGLLYCKRKPASSSVLKSSLQSISVLMKVLEYISEHFFQVSEDTTHIEEEDDDEENINEDEIWQLNVWDPSKFSLYVFMTLNPVNLLLIHNLTSIASTSSMLFGIGSIASISATFYFVISRFLDLINDKQILYQEMFQEYNNKFVKPKTNILKKDLMIDATQGPYESEVLVDINPYLFNKSRLFVTHDVKGRQINEYVQPDEDEARDNSIREQIQNSVLLKDSTEILARLRHDNENLMARNNQFNRRLSAMGEDQHYSFVRSHDNDVGEDEHDRDWYTSSTPFTSRHHNVESSRFSIPKLERNSSISYTPRLQSPSFFNRSPSPIRSGGHTPSLQRSPSPVRSPSLNRRPSINNRSPSRPSPAKQFLGFEPLPFNKSINNNNLNKSPFRSPSPTRQGFTDQYQPFRSPSPKRHPPSESPKPKWK